LKIYYGTIKREFSHIPGIARDSYHIAILSVFMCYYFFAESAYCRLLRACCYQFFRKFLEYYVNIYIVSIFILKV